MSSSTDGLSAEEHARLDSYMLILAGEARGHHKHDGSGKHTFGSKGAYCVYADGQYHDFSGSGPTAHGHGALAQTRHLYPDVDSVEWARAFLAAHPGMGDFVPSADTSTKGSAEEDAERLAYLTALYTGAPPRFEDTPGWRFLTETRRLPLPPEVLALLRWIPNFRGDEGVILVPYTGHAGELLALGFTYITQDGQKSPHSPARMIYRGPSDWNSRALIRLGEPGKAVVETEGLEKALALLAGGAKRVLATGGVTRLGVVPLEPQVQEVTIARDDDPPGSEQDQALWRAVVLRMAQDLKVTVTARPSETFGKQTAPFKDIDDVHRVDPTFVPILLKGANLEHGRLGEAVEDAIVEAASWLSAVPLGRVAKGIAPALRTTAGRFIEQVEKLIQARNAQTSAPGVGGPDGLPGQALTFPPLESWLQPVDGAELLSAISDALLKYVRMTRSEADAIALCAVHGHCFDCFDIMVIVAITSPHKRSGKTRLARLAGRMAPKPLFISGGSAAFVTRAMELHHLNLFADEFDTVVKGDPEKAEAIRGVFNALFDREGAFIGKCVSTENGHDPRMFSIWGPAWLSGIKKVWDTIEDRAVCIRLKRKVTRDKVGRLRVKDGPEFAEFRRKAARWAADNDQALRDADPPCPNSLADYSDRATDTWGVLFSIAQVADKSGGWLKRAHSASLVLNGLQDETGAETEVVVDKDDETALLVDVRTILLALDASAPEADALRNDKQIAVKAMDEARGLADAGQKAAKTPVVTPGISGVQLAEALARPHLFPDREWSEWARGKPVKSSHLIKLFREYGIEQKSIRLPGISTFMWGFTRPALDDAFDRYVSFSGGMPLGDQKKSSHSHITDNIPENIEENGEKRNPDKSLKTASEIVGEPSNSGDEGCERATVSHTPQKPDRASLTPENAPSEVPKPPHHNIVDLPIGAVPRRRKEAEP